MSIHSPNPLPAFLVAPRPRPVRAPPDERKIRARLLAAAHTRCPVDYSCRTLHSRTRLPALGITLALLAVLWWTAPFAMLSVLMVWAGFTTLVMAFIRVQALRALHIVPLPAFLTPPPLHPPPDITLLVPLFHEENTLPQLLRALKSLEYPPEHLEIFLLIEEVDKITAAALESIPLPRHIRPISVPRDHLQTKPKAMNYALPFCTGDIIGIYDAEDRPEPDQLQKVAAQFAAAPADVACLQGQLDYYNARENWIARCFTIEYAMWFRVVMHGVQALGLPIPLGGTTLFFRRDILLEIGGWDAHNVTEDADLGMRLARFGYRTEIIETTTWEEANHRPLRWIRQRSRWLKGFAMTWASHMRNPRKLWRDLGPRGFIGLQVLLLTGLTGFLAMPLFWMLWAGFFGFPLIDISRIPAPVWWGFVGAMAAGQVTHWTTAVAVTRRRRHLLPYVFMLPLYWPMGALAAYKAMAEVVFAPFYWDKTPHGDQPKEKPARPSGPMVTSSTAPLPTTNGG